LPASGGASIHRGVLPWGLVIIGVFSIFALTLGFRVYRRSKD
jgi:hypothetical protein